MVLAVVWVSFGVDDLGWWGIMGHRLCIRMIYALVYLSTN